MSLVTTWVKAVNGKYYDNPKIGGEDWFVCFDDDDPPELVVRADIGYRNPYLILKSAGLKFSKIKYNPTGSRGFGSNHENFFPAKSYFFNLKAPIPVPQEFERVIDSRDQIGQGCIEGEF